MSFKILCTEIGGVSPVGKLRNRWMGVVEKKIDWDI